jgi:hypothetical protein
MSISSTVGVPLSTQLSTLFQNAYSNSLLKNSPGGVANLASQALNMPVPGSNPINPLQGVSAVTGLNAFVQEIQQKAILSKFTALLGGGLGGGAAADPITQLLGALGGGGGLGAAGGINPLALLGAADASGVPGTVTPAAVVGPQVPQGDVAMIAQLQAMLGMVQKMMGGASPFQGSLDSAGNAGAAAGVVPPIIAPPQVLVQQPAIIPAAQLLQPGAATPQQQVVQQPGAVGLGGVPPQGITPSVNFSVVDNAINQTLGSIFATLPLVKL